MTDPAGTLEKALERNLFNVRHDRRWPLLELTLGEVLDDPSDSNKTRIPRRWKCSRRVCPIQLRGQLTLFLNSSSVRIVTPSPFALSNLEPGSSPATTKSTFLDTMETVLAPSFSTKDRASSLP